MQEFDTVEKQEEYDFYNDFSYVTVPAKTLPSGWNWHYYNDGSGCLQSPEGKDYFLFDRATCNWKGVEYQEKEGLYYAFHWGSMRDFQEYAEQYILRMLQKQTPSVQPDIVL